MAGLSEEQYFRIMQELFETKGWMLLEEEFEKEIYNTQADALEAKSWEEVQRLRGRAERLAEMLSMREMLRTQQEEFDADVPL